MTEPDEQPLIAVDVLVDARDDLVLVSAGVEVVDGS